MIHVYAAEQNGPLAIRSFLFMKVRGWPQMETVEKIT
jgi:hypothetical protein